MNLHCGLVLAGLLAGGSAWSVFAAGQQDSLQQILAQQAEVKRQLDTGQLANLTPRQVNTLRTSQSEVLSITEGARSLDDLDIAGKVRLENALERINAVMVGTRAAAREQQVCKRVPVTGSTTKVTRCATRAEWEQIRETSRDALEKQRVCVPPGCGG